MGSQTTKIKEGKLVLLSTTKHRTFGKVQIFQVKNKDLKVFCARSKHLSQFPELRMGIKHENFINPVSYDHEIYEVLGISNSYLNFYFQLQELSLEKIIYERSRQQQYFQIEEVLSVARQLLDLLVFLKQNDISIGNIEPSTIFYDQQTNLYKVYDYELILGPIGAYNIIEEAEQFRKPYSNAEIIYHYQKKLNGQDYLLENRFKSDLFSLGLTLLEMCTFQSSLEIFDMKVHKILELEIKNRLQLVQNIYGDKLSSLISNLLVIDPQHRIETEQVLPYYHQLFNQHNQNNRKSIYPQNNRIDAFQNKQNIVSNQENSFRPHQAQQPQIAVMNQQSYHDNQKQQEQTNIPQNFYQSQQQYSRVRSQSYSIVKPIQQQPQQSLLQQHTYGRRNSKQINDENNPISISQQDITLQQSQQISLNGSRQIVPQQIHAINNLMVNKTPVVLSSEQQQQNPYFQRSPQKPIQINHNNIINLNQSLNNSQVKHTAQTVKVIGGIKTINQNSSFVQQDSQYSEQQQQLQPLQPHDLNQSKQNINVQRFVQNQQRQYPYQIRNNQIYIQPQQQNNNNITQQQLQMQQHHNNLPQQATSYTNQQEIPQNMNSCTKAFKFTEYINSEQYEGSSSPKSVEHRNEEQCFQQNQRELQNIPFQINIQQVQQNVPYRNIRDEQSPIQKLNQNIQVAKQQTVQYRESNKENCQSQSFLVQSSFQKQQQEQVRNQYLQQQQQLFSKDKLQGIDVKDIQQPNQQPVKQQQYPVTHMQLSEKNDELDQKIQDLDKKVQDILKRTNKITKRDGLAQK